MDSLIECVEHTVPCSHIRQYPRSTSASQEAILHLAVKQYRPRHDYYAPQNGDLTILACHASGFPKELYEPIWESLFVTAQSRPAGTRIRAIWIADVANQGQSGVMNEDQLGNDPSWYDYARDYLHLVNHFRADMIRPIAGFGHSMGGNVMINVALLHPRLLSTIVAIEPIINKSAAEMQFSGVLPLTVKRDTWSSKDAAMKTIVESPFYARWDGRSLNLFRQFGLRTLAPTDKDDAGSVTLTTTKDQEVLCFARAAFPADSEGDFVPNRTTHPDLGIDRNPDNLFYRPEPTITFQQLPFLRPSCMYIYSSSSHMASAKAQGRKDKMSVTGVATGGSGGSDQGRVAESILPGSHFLPFETPDAVATVVSDWYERELKRWASQEDTTQQAWDGVPSSAKSKVDAAWLLRAKEQARRDRTRRNASKI